MTVRNKLIYLASVLVAFTVGASGMALADPTGGGSTIFSGPAEITVIGADGIPTSYSISSAAAVDPRITTECEDVLTFDGPVEFTLVTGETVSVDATGALVSVDPAGGVDLDLAVFVEPGIDDNGSESCKGSLNSCTSFILACDAGYGSLKAGCNDDYNIPHCFTCTLP